MSTLLPWPSLWFPSDDHDGLQNRLYLVLAGAIEWPYHARKAGFTVGHVPENRPLGLIIGPVIVGFSVFRQGGQYS